MPYYLATDLGTTGCRSIIFNSELELIASSYEEYPLYADGVGVVEQDAMDYWRLTLKTAASAIKKSGISPLEIRAIGISSQGITLIPVDKTLTPIRRAMSWLDVRATEEADRIAADFGEEIFTHTGKRASAAYTLPKILWLMKNEPEIYEAAYKLLTPCDFLVAKLTGMCVVDHSMASGTLYYDLKGACWSKKILGKYGIDEEKLPKIAAATEAAGRVTDEVVSILGLCPDCVVAVSAQDQKCAAFGVGLDSNTITVSLGTACAVTKLWGEAKTEEVRNVGWCGYVDDAHFVTEGVVGTAGTCLRWVRDNFYPGEDYGTIDSEAAAAKERDSALIFHPYLSGAGNFYGVNLSTVRGDFALAVMEGVAFNIRELLEKMNAYGNVDSLTLFGGGAKGDFWCQLIADITGLTIKIPSTTEAAGAGAARLAAIAVGDRISALEIKKSYAPTKDYTKKYNEYLSIEEKLWKSK